MCFHEKTQQKLKLKCYIQMTIKVDAQGHHLPSAPSCKSIQSIEELIISKYKYTNPFTTERIQINEEKIN